jgi:signal transduction histidine kinase
MGILRLLRPKFWDHRDVAAGPFRHLFNFRRIWKQSVLLTAVVTLLPLFWMTLMDYNVTHKAFKEEINFRTSRLVSNAKRTISYFLIERRSALDFIVQDNEFGELLKPRRLKSLLAHLKKAYGGFTDLGVIDQHGEQRAYAGPYTLSGVNYSGENWYQQVREKGLYISEVFLGIRKEPHFIIAVRHQLAESGQFYVIRATIDTERFNELLANLHVGGNGDAFIINRKGILQTPSSFYGPALDHVAMPVPEYSEHTRVTWINDKEYGPRVRGYAYLKETPFVLIICKRKQALLERWWGVRLQILGLLSISVVGVMIVILGVSSYLVERIYEADQRRVSALHHVEYSNKMASIGRLAAGVAHEINNPLAIINEKAGLIKDMFMITNAYAEDKKLMGLVDSIIKSVDRCSAITGRLLSFARHMGGDSGIGQIDIKDVVDEVLGFLQKEADHRSIDISVDIPESTPKLRTNRGKLQQILLNLINNSFAAVSDGGHLEITSKLENNGDILLSVSDDGCGIPKSDIQRVFEPFFTTKDQMGGTGLGLSITYGLVTELGGRIEVESEPGKGSTFTIILPQIAKESKGEDNENSFGGR